MSNQSICALILLPNKQLDFLRFCYDHDSYFFLLPNITSWLFSVPDFQIKKWIKLHIIDSFLESENLAKWQKSLWAIWPDMDGVQKCWACFLWACLMMTSTWKTRKKSDHFSSHQQVSLRDFPKNLYYINCLNVKLLKLSAKWHLLTTVEVVFCCYWELQKASFISGSSLLVVASHSFFTLWPFYPVRTTDWWTNLP